MSHRKAVSVVVCMLFALSLCPTALAQGKKPVKGKPGPTATTGVLKLVCPIEGADFVIDEGMPSEQRGKTPAKDPIQLQPGPHTIRVSKEGHLPFSDVFDIVTGQEAEVSAELVHYSGRLAVETVPPGAQIEVDGRDMGQGPLQVSIAIGEHVVRVSKLMYRESVQKVTVTTGQDTVVKVKLMAEAEAQKREGGGPITKKWWFWTAIGGSAAAIAAAAVAIPLVLGKAKTKNANAGWELQLR